MYTVKIVAYWCLLCSTLVGTGCLSRTAFYGVNPIVPKVGQSYQETIEKLGNPSVLERLSTGEYYAIYAGNVERGGEVSVAYYVPWLTFGRTSSKVVGQRLLFGTDSRIKKIYPLGMGDAAWGINPFVH